MKKTLFISDVHLGSKGSNASELLSLLKREDFDELFIVGDFIDGWLLKRRFYWKPKFTEVIRKVLSLAKKGVKVTYVVGNHDEFLRDYLPFGISNNIKIVNECEWNGYLITHGDLYDGVVQLRWLGILGSIGYEIAIYIDRFMKRLGYKKSISKMLKDKVKGAIKFITNFEKQLAFQAQSNGLKGVICGHIHTPADKYIDINGKEIHYINCGDWIENNTYVISEIIGDFRCIYIEKYK